MALLEVLLAAGTCFAVSGLSRLSLPLFRSRPSTLHHSLQEESGVSVSAPGPRTAVTWLFVVCGWRVEGWDREMVCFTQPHDSVSKQLTGRDLHGNLKLSTLSSIEVAVARTVQIHG